MEFDIGLGRVFKYCPKCGAAALRLAGAKLLHCDACGFELYLNAAASVAALILDAQNRLLITVRAEEPRKDTWDLPGGFVDPGETAEQAVCREVREEVGLEVTSMRYLGSRPNTYEYGGVRYATMDMGFACEANEAERAAPCEESIAAVLFLRPEEIKLENFAFNSLATLVEAHMLRGAPRH